MALSQCCSLLVALSLALCLLIDGCSCHVIRGVNPALQGSYRSDRDFTCLDGSATVPFALVNDDYCDCGDGSDEPGTAACTNARFHCPNKGHRSADILSSRVNDGICDCCDGSDEYGSAVDCPDTCEEFGRKAREEAERHHKLQLEGHVKRLDYSQQGAQKREEFTARQTELEREVAELDEEMEQLRQSKEAAEEPEKAAKDEHQRKWEEEKEARKKAQELAEAKAGFEELDTNSDGFVSTAELMARPELDDDGDGEVSEAEALEYLDSEQQVDFDVFLERVWTVVSDKCQFSVPQQGETEAVQVPEEQGHPEEEEEEDFDDDRDYDDDDDEDYEPEAKDSEEMPEYDPATKELIKAADEARDKFRTTESRKRDLDRELEDVKKYLDMSFGHSNEFSPLYDQCYEFSDREYTFKFCPFSKVTQRSKSGGRETSLGTWGSWNGPSNQPYASMKYENGEKCWNGPSRSAIIKLQCGMTDELLSASEPNRCEYAMDFATPAVCDPQPSKLPHSEL